jgi:hypothetical protein
MRWLAIVFLLTQSLWAAVGNISQAQQQPSVIQRQKQSLPGVKGASLEMKDVIKTGAGSVAVTFADNTQMQVTEHSQLLIDEFVYDPNNKSSGKLAMKVALGTVRYASGAIAKNDPSRVAIHTPTATVGVRGTDFTSTVDELGRSTIILLPSCPAGWTNIERDCVTGAINVSTESATVFMNRPFQATYVSNSNLPPTAPVILNITEDNIRNLLIVNQPAELKAAADNQNASRSALDVDPLVAVSLGNQLDNDPAARLDQDLLPNLLDQDFVNDIVKKVQKQIAAAPRIAVQTVAIAEAPVAKTETALPVSNGDEIPTNGETPRYLAATDVTNNAILIKRDENEATRILIEQNGQEITNTLNVGGSTIIIIKQVNR